MREAEKGYLAMIAIGLTLVALGSYFQWGLPAAAMALGAGVLAVAVGELS